MFEQLLNFWLVWGLRWHSYRNGEMKDFELFKHWSRQVNSCPIPWCLLGQIQAQKLPLLVTTNESFITLRVESSITSIDRQYHREGHHREFWGIPALREYSYEDFQLRTNLSHLLLRRTKLDLKLHKTWICEEDQCAKPFRKP